MKTFITRFETKEEFDHLIKQLKDSGYLGQSIAIGVMLDNNIPIGSLDRLNHTKCDCHLAKLDFKVQRINDTKYIYLDGLKEVVTGLSIDYEDRKEVANKYKALMGKDNVRVSLHTLNDDLDGDTSRVVIKPVDVFRNIKLFVNY